VLVVADTSVLLNLCCVGHDHLLPALFREVHIPTAVHAEFIRLASRSSRFRGLAVPTWVTVSSVVAVPDTVSACLGLDAGETEALALALQIRADAVLLDEAAARNAAVQLHLAFIGIAGILLRAKAQCLIPAVRPVLERLRTDANFWLTVAFEANVLRLAGESA
jgi:predicted nucleic acid-binding protein